MTQARLLEIKAAAANTGNVLLNEICDQCLKLKRQMVFLDPQGGNVQNMLDVRHYKWLVSLMGVTGVFPHSIPETVKKQIVAICNEMGEPDSE